jgi:branched-chain amino acid transport system permease protein
MAVGAYTVGILTVDHQVPFWIAFAAGGRRDRGAGLLRRHPVAAAEGPLLLDLHAVRGYIMFLLIEKWESLTHGHGGHHGHPGAHGHRAAQFGTPLSQYYLVLAFLVLGLWSWRASCARCWAAPSWRCATATSWPRRWAST